MICNVIILVFVCLLCVSSHWENTFTVLKPSVVLSLLKHTVVTVAQFSLSSAVSLIRLSIAAS